MTIETVSTPVQMVPPEVLVPTGMIDGIPVVEVPAAVAEEVVAEAIVAEAVEETPPEASVEAPAEPVIVKKRRGRPPRSATQAVATSPETRKMGRPFWEMMSPQELVGYLGSNYHHALHPLVAKVMSQGYGVARTASFTGIMSMPREDVEKQILSMGGRLVMASPNNWVYVWKDSEIRIALQAPPVAQLSLRTCDQGMFDYWSEFSTRWLTPVPPRVSRPEIYSFLSTMRGIEVLPVGTLNDEFTPGNYPTQVVEDYHYIRNQLTASDPTGRLAILEGVPGTGKTRLIRALICETMQTARCILVAPNVLPHLSGAQFLGALIDQQRYDMPLVLILEDADACLIARDEDKASLDALTGLLNLSDGILGATLDLRIVATTNAKLEKLDAAILRPGRLIRRVEMGPLDKEQASEAFKRITGKEQAFDSATTIAEVYAAAVAVGDMERAAKELAAKEETDKAVLADAVEDLELAATA